MKNMEHSLQKNGGFLEDNSQDGKQNEFGLQVVNQVSAMVAYWDRDEICRFANIAYVKWHGRTHKDLIGKMLMKEFLGPLYDNNLPHLKEVLKGKTQVFEQETLCKSGVTHHSVTTYTADKVNGIVKGFFVHVTDITQTKIKEEELIRKNEIITDQNNRLANYTYLISYTLKSKSAHLRKALNSFIEASTEKEKEEILGFLYNISSKFSETVKSMNEYASMQSKVNLELGRKQLVQVSKAVSKSPHQLTDYRKNGPTRGV